MTLIIFGVKLLLGAMKASRQQASENRARVLRVAARRFREGAIAGVSVADVMHEAGLTHGGFYKRFASKQDLIAQACALGLPENLEAYKQLWQGVDGTRLKRLRWECCRRCTVIFRRRVASWLPWGRMFPEASARLDAS
jgi:AcrR family transcriptional regulator